MNDDTAETIGMHTNVEEIKQESSQLAAKSRERMQEIEDMIDFVKDSPSLASETKQA